VIRPPEAGAQVRILPGALKQFEALALEGRRSKTGSWNGRSYSLYLCRISMPSRPRGQCGHLEQLPSGSYRAVVHAGVDLLTGKERRLKECAKTLKAAEVALTKLQRQVDEELPPKTDIDAVLDGDQLPITARCLLGLVVGLLLSTTRPAHNAGRPHPQAPTSCIATPSARSKVRR
jgi:hypothetical protein